MDYYYYLLQTLLRVHVDGQHPSYCNPDRGAAYAGQAGN